MLVDGRADVVWRPSLGAIADGAQVRFHVWAPGRRKVELVLDPNRAPRRFPLAAAEDGIFSAEIDSVRAGGLYSYLVDGEGPFPDPCSRFQPLGVHGPSAVVDHQAFPWTDREWRGLPLERAVFYELHVGTFTPAGTFAGAIERLPYLADLGVSVVELMPVADFPGRWNWGYDGVSLFAPSRQYGAPDDLRRLVDAAHRLGLAVLLDVVYNHWGPDGNYSSVFSPYYRSPRHQSPWGPAVNLDGEHARGVRAFFIENALHWVHEYHLDGLRLDATHWLLDDSHPHFVAELTARVRESVARTLLIVAEDERNLATMVERRERGGWGLDAVWADDFHHQVRRRSAGDRDGYYQDYTGSIADLAATLRQGWFYCGQHSSYAGAPRGTPPAGVPLERMIICLQNHDQIGNRPFGNRLHHQIEPALYRALSALLLFAPETPLLFMGQEWSASTPFLFFTDHHAELGRLVTSGRRAEFARFDVFADEQAQARIPDPQAETTFAASCLNWDERAQGMHAGVLNLYRALLALRRGEPVLSQAARAEIAEVDDRGLTIVRRDRAGDEWLLVAWLHGPGLYEHSRPAASPPARWSVVLHSDEPRFRDRHDLAAAAPEVRLDDGLAVRFHQPGAVILRVA